MKKTLLSVILAMFSSSSAFLQTDFQSLLLTIDFENGADSIISYYNVSGTQWQKGVPQKTVLDTAYSPDHAMVTDTVNPYAPGTYTYFEVPFVPNDYGVFDFSNFVCPLKMCFRHKSDWDPAAAGGWVSLRDNNEYLSEFGGFSTGIYGLDYYYWMFEFYNDSSGWMENIAYDTLYNDTLGFGQSDTSWKHTCTEMSWIALSPGRAFDTLYYRFSFMSDTLANPGHEGWMIDDIQIGQGWGVCAGSIEEQTSTMLWVYPNPANEYVRWEVPYAYGQASFDWIDVHGKIIQSGAANTSMIQTTGLTNGLYILRLNIDGKQVVKKIMVQH